MGGSARRAARNRQQGSDPHMSSAPPTGRQSRRFYLCRRRACPAAGVVGVEFWRKHDDSHVISRHAVMGYSISWIAFQTNDKHRALSLIGLVDTGEADEANEAPVSGATLPTGWYVVFFNDYSFTTPERLATFSADCAVVACQVEEHVMASGSFLYEEGRRVWSVTHESERGRYDLSVDGEPPDVFCSLRDSLFEEQDGAGGEKADVDFVFDIPVQLAAELCGYKHDRWKFDWGEPAFFRLEPAKRRSWLRWR